ncbi:fructose-bisphosphate aldolase class I [Legionella taurinensis]|uniref:Probable fructose-bisphosphate aldolase class 1 n=1 Tax=Legionella taurinensis TaxID=70611 RepID=A0A3A5LKV7_9GAMM|nr:class I fructose-bisphosphate aldolase [Legionella taurinensis]MDX1837684.1 class I fructose-bisphosphate aldolase [Legionella taurinensis]PUT39969.1 fructose-bisphosphate aldolase class I [Legionella taurinensis]PUT43735.1 fructose-bisphosphate aldolase class I [Legionella taurinensis]PUT46132.1 fructose-bisphosphate aldolase class I [Legionella taurinensis]PUT47890.1 fructose-bisphosphate aldolase class I [Legionella taurinensis]
MFYDELSAIMDHLLQDGKGILAADESNGTIGKRFESIGVENTEDNRRDYRLLLANTAGLEQYINGVILFEETFQHKDQHGTPIAQLFANNGIMPGIKVDKGLVDLANTDNEKITQGLDGLKDRLVYYKELGAKFAKWRNVYSITEYTPSLTAIKAGAEVLARYAAVCQSVGIVPIVEPELLMDGNHDIDHCAEAYEMVLHELFHSLFIHQVDLEQIVLKPSMVTSGKEAVPFSSPEEVADYTINVFRSNVPAAVPTINFLSGGQTPQQATVNLNAINSTGYQPWTLSFSYGRALQEDCLKIWGGKAENVEAAQAALLKRARLNSAACFGEYRPDME